MNVEVLSACSRIVSAISLGELVAAGIAIVTLMLNILFYIIIAPRIGFRFQKKEDFLKYSSDFMTYLAQVSSSSDLKGAPTKVKNYCESIQLLFKNGKAPKDLRDCMEDIFQLVKTRKDTAMTEDEVEEWAEVFRKKTHELRSYLARYTGVFRS
jgi:hypothetical protein